MSLSYLAEYYQRTPILVKNSWYILIIKYPNKYDSDKGLVVL
jgi:hypothetical protein